MNVGVYKKKPVEIQAVQLSADNLKDVARWCRARSVSEDSLLIPTLEGLMTGLIGNYVIRGVQGEFYPCRSDIFEQTYEQVA